MKAFNTMRLDSVCENMVEFDTVEDCPSAMALAEELSHDGRVDIIGGGSNIVFSDEYHGVLVHPAILGWDVNMLENGAAEVVIGAGVELDSLVSYLASAGFWGLENLSGIPGTVGGAAVQNAGAYGLEFGDFVKYVKVWNCKEKKFEKLPKKELNYGYRFSTFKMLENSGRYIVLEVSIEVSKKFNPQLSYGPLKQISDCDNLTPVDVRDKIIAIRESKLPKVDEVGSAGSYFKNPVLDQTEWNQFCDIIREQGVEIDTVPHFVTANNMFKVPAAWLIERCDWKGKILGNAGVWHNQPLILVNATGKATANEILMLEEAIISDVKKRFGIELKPEVVRL
ncbi:MAG: UDP-N-acetylmuramate dehydrogenase [Paramuribaculum sp.]|nr:UDP-N-acetylmuramate dehydrogenase [Paramuribaculum sp.]